MKKIVNLFLVVVTMLFVSVVNVKADENLDAMFEKIAPNGIFTINFRAPKNTDDVYNYSSAYISGKYQDYYGSLYNCNEDYTECTLSLENYKLNVADAKQVKVVWQEEYSEMFKKILSADNVLRANFRKPQNQYDAQRFLNGYIKSHYEYDINLNVRNCNADYSECIITIYNNQTPGNLQYVGESNVVNIEWYEEYSEDFKTIAPNNVVIVKDMQQFSDDSINDYSTSYFDKYYPNIRGIFENCDSNYTTCDLAFYKNGEHIITEIHKVQVIWQEEYSELFSSIAPNGILNIKSIKPQKEEDLELYSSSALSQSFKNVLGYLYDCNEDYTECNLSITDITYVEDGYSPEGERHRVKITWEKENPVVRKLVDAAVAAIKLGNKHIYEYDDGAGGKNQITEYYYVLEDLNLINYLKNKNANYNNIINYVPGLKLLFENTNITYNLDARLGDAGYFSNMGGGILSLLYKGVVYALVNPYKDIDTTHTSVYSNYVLYIPSDTANTKEAYLKAIKTRLDEYLKTDVKVEIGGLIKDYTKGEKLEIPHFDAKENQIGDYYYKVTINNETYDFLVVRDTSKMVVNNLIKSVDIDTNVKIETNATDIPNDVVINVTPVTQENNSYKKIVDSLKTDLFQAFDINLYSDSLGKNITKTETGEFKITIPIAEALKGKDLMVYYIKDDNTLEEHPVTIDDEGNAVFTTNHFSTYILAEKITKDNEDLTQNIPDNEQTSENPQTNDNIMMYLTLGLISLSSLAVIIKKYRIN